jgi:hypothetical protein
MKSIILLIVAAVSVFAADATGKAENGNLTFDLPAGGGVMKFVLKQAGEEIKGNISAERDGEKKTATLAVKREK